MSNAVSGVYQVALPWGDTFLFSVGNWGDASSRVMQNFSPDGDPDSWSASQWQVVDGNHSEDRIARLLIGEMGRDIYADPDDDRDDEAIVAEMAITLTEVRA